MLLLSSADFFFKINYFQKAFTSGTVSEVSNSLDPDQHRSSVGPDLGPNCLHLVISRQKKFRPPSKELKI